MIRFVFAATVLLGPSGHELTAETVLQAITQAGGVPAAEQAP